MPQGRFNAGQKLNAILTAAFAVLFASPGSSSGSASATTGSSSTATGTVHDTLMLVSVALLAGHLYLAADPPDDTARAARDDAGRRARGLGAASTTRSGWRTSAGYNPRVASYRYVVADVFTDTPLHGNQLAVFTDARGLDDATMQALALEIGFSETVFVLPAEAGRHGADADLQPARTRCRSRGIRPSAPRSCSARRSSSA